MKILVIMDGDGHFHATHPTDRPATLKMIQNIQDGDYFYNIVNDDDIKIKSDLSEYCCKDWNDLIDNFIQRGTLEYVTLSTTVPKGCACATK